MATSHPAPERSTVFLRGTDNSGASAVSGETITVLPPNVPPTAAFTSSCNGLVCSFDGTASSDSDGTVVSYAWDFGDGSSATGAATSHTYAATSNPTITLTVTDDRGGTGTVSHQVSVLGPNVPPNPSFTASCAAMVCGFNGSASVDPDGTITNYAWNFGDGTTGTGVTANHTFTVAGYYTVTLAVTDDRGATVSTMNTVDPLPNAAPGPYATDTFTRTVTNGWGTADTAAAWTLGTTASASPPPATPPTHHIPTPTPATH